METNRPLRFFLAMKMKSLSAAVAAFIDATIGSELYQRVEDIGDADLVFITNPRDVESYSTDKQYAFICTAPHQSEPGGLPKNCRIISMTRLAELVEAMAEIRTNLTPISDDASTEPVELLPDAMRILVVDDLRIHRNSAHRDLAGHRLVVVDGYQAAMKALKEDTFEVVLTDLHMPMSSQMLGDKFRPDELVPYGLLLRDEAALQGAKHVAVVTDLSHHDDPFSAAFDHFSSRPIRIEGATVHMLHAYLHQDGSKDWAWALNRLIGA